MFAPENVTRIDHLLVLVFTLVLPVLTLRSYPKLVEVLKSDIPGVRINAYIQSIFTLWILAGVTLGAWFYQGRGFEGIGFVITGSWKFFFSLGIVVLIILFLTQQIFEVRRKKENRDKIRRELERISFDALVPHSDKELKVFMLVAISAGVCEEIMYRGFLIPYLSHYTDAGLALVLSSVLFGMGHLYQGFTGVIRTMLVGAAFAVLYAISGSLLVPMILHAAIDIHAGITGKLSFEPIAGQNDVSSQIIITKDFEE